nr:uncharacterized protein LOC129383858 [Dermacentor andersoni]
MFVAQATANHCAVLFVKGASMSTEPRVNHSMVGVMEQQIHWLNVSLTRSPPKMVMRDGATGVDRFSAPPSATLPCDNAIKEEASRVFACGHGAGIVNMRLNHPFLFLVQEEDDGTDVNMDVDVDMEVDVDMDVHVDVVPSAAYSDCTVPSAVIVTVLCLQPPIVTVRPSQRFRLI